MRRLLVLTFLLSGLLSGCVGPRTYELAGECWQDDPASVWVVENGLDIRARTVCRNGYTVLSKGEVQEATHKEIHWTIACAE